MSAGWLFRVRGSLWGSFPNWGSDRGSGRALESLILLEILVERFLQGRIYESKGRGFESRRAHHERGTEKCLFSLCFKALHAFSNNCQNNQIGQVRELIPEGANPGVFASENKNHERVKRESK